MPLEIEGKRERHKVERMTITSPTPKKPAAVVKMGDGVPLGEIAYIEEQLQKHRSEELKTLHRVLYGTAGKMSILKKEIRKFTGFGFEEGSPEFKKKVALLGKLTTDQLRLIKNILGLHSGGSTKDALVTTIMLFLMKTVDHARGVPKKRKSSAKTPTTAKRARKSKGSEEVGVVRWSGTSCSVSCIEVKNQLLRRQQRLQRRGRLKHLQRPLRSQRRKLPRLRHRERRGSLLDRKTPPPRPIPTATIVKLKRNRKQRQRRYAA
ncbi:hypothetical protein COOONC_20401 [Cooperia oncophora]